MFEGLRKKFKDAINVFAKKEETQIAKQEEKEPVAPQSVPPQEAKIEHKPVPAAMPQKETQRLESVSLPPITPAKTPEVKRPQPQVELKPKHTEHASRSAPGGQDRRPPTKEDDEVIKLSLLTKIKKTVFGSVVLSDSEVDDFLSKLKISMLESDVTFDVAEEFSDDLANRLKGKKVESRDIAGEIVRNVREALLDTLKASAPSFQFIEMIKAQKGNASGPFVILFLGPNGTGKTTTIAKIASRLKKEGVSVVLSASDTFRAAAIEQIEHHANKIGVPVIKSTYGADPASIAFDAIAYARAHNADVVLIDSAGRQETNSSLIREIEKMVRVSKPSMTIFVGESTAGNAIANQIVEFNKHVPIKGIILTKLDADAKGGSALSISKLTGIPILFFGIGESYDALVAYDPNFIADAILPVAS